MEYNGGGRFDRGEAVKQRLVTTGVDISRTGTDGGASDV
ncbi:hypothetical protein O979_00095 [Mycobacterium avium subsp. paratuberculosis 10-4404]|nr:hypothetical protein O979_00095 [Mycobacterium avium subsp. paratuberculosis 10-4404]ETB15254.1 hypothetical protein O980_00165 [Mycobacterium avium subsp. paratuberculosis 08-8281]ETB45249.1 hypothetical protein O975_00180 [Mycobacterium avium subsp. paratuberculosis 11-1786]